MSSTKTSSRLYVKAVFTGYKRGLRNSHESTTLLKLDGAYNKEDAQFYVGKRVVYVYKAKNAVARTGKNPTKVRTVTGKITRSHGNSGSVRAKFTRTLPPQAMGNRVRVLLF
uniref:Large ribosomal subunit protein eL33 n=1 Tax=Parastrongyloides trichosuri TaxID=131310 RepID=A0A0N4ZS90_PARTI